MGNQAEVDSSPARGVGKTDANGFSGNPPTPLPGLLLSNSSLTHGSAYGSTVGFHEEIRFVNWQGASGNFSFRTPFDRASIRTLCGVFPTRCCLKFGLSDAARY